MNIELPPDAHFLVMLPNNLGDVIMATPVLEGLKHRYPECSVSFLVEQGYEGGLVESPYCDRIVTIDRKHIRELLRGEQWQAGKEELRSFISDLNAFGFTSVVNLCQLDYISFLSTLVSASQKAGRRFLHEGNHAVPDLWSQYLYAIPYSRKVNRLHACDVYRRIAGVHKHSGGYTIALSQSEIDASLEYLGAKGVVFDGNERIAVFQPGAAYQSKCWPIEKFIMLGNLLIDQGWQLVISGAPSEIDTAGKIAEGLGSRCFVTTGETTFRQAVAIVAHCNACVTGDTALMHASAALGISVYALFGPTNPVETGPYGDGHWVFSSHCQKRPCFEYRCESGECLNVDPSIVFKCITGGEPGSVPGCDIFRTSLEPDGDYSLRPVGNTGMPYESPGAADIILSIFGEKNGPLQIRAEKETVEEMRSFIATVSEMRRELRGYLQTRDLEHIRNFESVKSDFNALYGIGAFLAAFLHIRLNSVPLLNPIEGVGETERQCGLVEETVARVLDSIA